MNDLSVLKRETQYGLAEFLAERGTWRKDRVVRAAETLEGIALHADQDGNFSGSLRAVGRAMGIGKDRVSRGARDLREVGAVTVDQGSLETKPRWYDRKKGWVGWDWEDRPTIIIHPDLRAKDSVHRLGDE